MTARTRWRRVRAFARACARWAACLFRPHTATELATLDEHQRHAWDQLPHNVKAQVVRP